MCNFICQRIFNEYAVLIYRKFSMLCRLQPNHCTPISAAIMLESYMFGYHMKIGIKCNGLYWFGAKTESLCIR